MPEETLPSATEDSQNNKQKNENDEWRKLLIALIFLLFSFSCIFCSSQTALLAINRDHIDASMESLLNADYGFDPLIALAPLKDGIGAEADRDEALLAGEYTILSQGFPVAVLPVPVPTPIIVASPTPPAPPSGSPEPTTVAVLPTPTSPSSTSSPPTSPPPTVLPPTSPPSTVLPPTSPPPTVLPPTSPPPTAPPPTSPPPTAPPPTSPPPTSPPSTSSPSTSTPISPSPTSPPATATATSVPPTDTPSPTPVTPSPTDTPVPVTISISDASVVEGLGNAVFTVTLSSASSNVISVDYRTFDDTAAAPLDYTLIPTTTLIFPSGTVTRLITVTVQGDVLYEGNETFFVNLTNPSNATISDNQGLGTIVDDELGPPTISINDVSVTEGNNAIFSVTLSVASSQPVSVDYATANDSATAPADYTAITLSTLNFAAGVTSQLITVTVQDDALYEGDETFFVNLTNPGNATISDNQGLGTIVDDETLTVDFETNAYSVTESNSPAIITVTLSTTSTLPVTVDYTTVSTGTAAIGSDYIPVSGTLNFAPGVTMQTFDVEIINDAGSEPDETVELALNNAVIATLGLINNPAILTIQDDDTGSCSIGTWPAEPNIGEPNCNWLEIAVSTNVVVTLPLTNSISPDGTSAFDMVYFERQSQFTPGQVDMDIVIIEVATDTAGIWYEVFNWGDGSVDTNTNIGQAGYGSSGEFSNVPIPMTNPPLHQSSAGGPFTGIAIDLDTVGVPLGIYRYIRISDPPTSSEPSDVDALQPFYP